MDDTSRGCQGLRSWGGEEGGPGRPQKSMGLTGSSWDEHAPGRVLKGCVCEPLPASPGALLSSALDRAPQPSAPPASPLPCQPHLASRPRRSCPVLSLETPDLIGLSHYFD